MFSCCIIFYVISCNEKNSDINQTISLSNIKYEIIEDDFSELPDFSKSALTRSGICDSIDVECIKAENYAIRFSGTTIISEDGKYKFTAVGGANGKFIIKDEQLFDFG